MLRRNSTNTMFGQASLCQGGFIWVQLTHIPPASAQIHEQEANLETEKNGGFCNSICWHIGYGQSRHGTGRRPRITADHEAPAGR
jgi:hypothetical protein